MANGNLQLKEWCYKELNTCRRVCKTREEMRTHCTFVLGAVQYAQYIGLVTYE